MPDISQHPWKSAWMTTSLRPQNPTTASSRQNSFAQLSNTQHFTRLYFQTCRIPTRHGKYTILPRESVPARKRGIYGYRYIHIREHYSEQVPCTQHTHTPGYRARESSTELPATEDGNFQHERHFHASTPMLRQPHRWKLPERDPEQTQSKMEKAQQSHPVK